MKLTNEEKCIYCREYGNLPCEECDKKLESKKAMKTKFTKVAVPDDYPGKIYQELHNHLCEEHGLILLESQMQDIIHIVNKMQSPDREDEMREMLEKLRIEIGRFESESNNSAEQFELSEMPNSSMCSKAMARAYNTCSNKIESLLQSLKQEK